MIAQVLFLLLAAASVGLFTFNVKKIIRNIRLGRPLDRSDRKAERWMVLLKVAFGQTKMVVRPVPGILHLLIYAGFIIINMEVLEIAIDGILGTHRVFSFAGMLYSILTGTFEWLALGVLLACVVFLIRRNVIRLKRFTGTEMTSWPRSDANYILLTEILLMTAYLTMNAADRSLQLTGAEHYKVAGAFPVSAWLMPLMPANENTLVFVERACWWFHITGIFAFLNYLPYSKHFHIIMAFPNTWYSNLEPKGEFTNMQSVTNEVKAMLDPSFVPGTAAETSRFGAKDVTDLSWKSLMDAYTCTECGRCTSECPANITGKLLSPRKIMMDTRDRLTEAGKHLDKGTGEPDGKSLLDDYITREEIWACTTCNACTRACPVNIDPLSIIVELRRYAVMEESQAPASINNMFGNTENNGAPWKYPASDRFAWANDT
ncbi:(Fe-S)-binding protein [Hufsiella ginkgonis]|uniref:4Fe-4S dicluster domain-containing protein n=1 Tax=Hufsiella ginkgonis TaxID=2695274 RepID=A0A7K1XV27_9SPHI|nr:(Fe-S)-binding protein [Hufsiella ginkgonis]MXV14657.1 4Fe-4S dicluster domain-containing protein [Hufsiella ginkgonis]